MPPTHTANIHLGIVCPMANERATAADFVASVLAQCRRRDFGRISFFAVLDTVSRDGTRELLREMAQCEPSLRVVWAPENRSVVDAYLRGYREALGAGCDWILEIDAGFSHQPQDIGQFFETMAQGCDCVFGSRFCVGGTMAQSPLRRRVISRGGSLLTNALLGTRLRDMTSGFQLFSRAALQDVLDKGIHSRGHFFQTEIKVHCRHLSIAEVPICYRAPSDSVTPNVLRDAFGTLWRLFRQRLRGTL